MGRCTWFEDHWTEKDGSSKHPYHSPDCAYDNYCEDGSNRCLFHEDKDEYSEDETEQFSRTVKKMLRENHAIWEDENGKQYIDLFGFIFPEKLPLSTIIPPKPHMPLCFNGMTQKNDDVIHADFRDISFSGATIAGTNFSRSRLDGTILRNTKFGKKDKHGNWDCRWYHHNRYEKPEKLGLFQRLLTKLPLVGKNIEKSIKNKQDEWPELPIFTGANVEAADWADNREAQRDFVYAEYIRQFKKKHKGIAKLWKFTCDYGRNIWQWALISLGFMALFGGAYSLFQLLGTDNIWESFYFSIVSFTTLGFGDITPNTIVGQILAAAEVIIGYVMLGGLISIFAVKIARRD